MRRSDRRRSAGSAAPLFGILSHDTSSVEPPAKIDARRATRLPLAIEIEYRFAQRGNWRAARTINLSRSGVLFESESEPPVGHPIEFVLRLARGMDTTEVRDLHCQGRLVRAENRVGGLWGVAATIESYQDAAE